jgi:hypothetical protein
MAQFGVQRIDKAKNAGFVEPSVYIHWLLTRGRLQVTNRFSMSALEILHQPRTYLSAKVLSGGGNLLKTPFCGTSNLKRNENTGSLPLVSGCRNNRRHAPDSANQPHLSRGAIHESPQHSVVIDAISDVSSSPCASQMKRSPVGHERGSQRQFPATAVGMDRGSRSTNGTSLCSNRSRFSTVR